MIYFMSITDVEFISNFNTSVVDINDEQTIEVKDKRLEEIAFI